MKRKILAWLLVTALLLCGMAVSPQPARADGPEGEWVLIGVEDKTPEDVFSSDSSSGTGWFYKQESATKYRYARCDFAIDWYNEHSDEKGSSRNEGTIRASFGVLPERIKPNEPLSIPVNIQSSCSLEAAEYIYQSTTVSAGIECTRYLFTGEGGETAEVWYTIPSFPETPYEQTQTLGFSLPEPSENLLAMGETDTITFDFMLVIPGSPDAFITAYTYE
ncbi:MAG: hypothetical protein PHO66_00110 [Eubacteriales bacterium]|nr:hypothetical protein [Eubacteriales bacterium]